MKKLLACITPFCFLPAFSSTLPAQTGPVLVVERREDLRERNRFEAMLRVRRIDVDLTHPTRGELVSVLKLRLPGVTFLLAPDLDADEELSSLRLKLRRARARDVFRLVERMCDLRFVFRSGAILLEQADRVKEYAWLEIYDLRAATFKVRNFRGPRLDQRVGDDEEQDEAEEEGGTASGLTLDKVEEMIRETVRPDSWGEKASISGMNGILFVRQSAGGHREVRDLLVQLGVIAPAPRLRPRRAVVVRARRSRAPRRAGATRRRGGSSAPAKPSPTKTGAKR